MVRAGVRGIGRGGGGGNVEEGGRDKQRAGICLKLGCSLQKSIENVGYEDVLDFSW